MFKRTAAAVILLATLVGFFSCRSVTQRGPGLNVLFIGNSYTSTNDLPTIFQEVAVSTGQASPIVKSSTPGGYTFQDHLASSETRSMISSQSWDVVIMQEQSEVPSAAQTSPEVNKSFLAGFDGLYKLVKASNPQTRVILFETWARNADLWVNDTADLSMDGKNPSDMLRRLKAAYEEASLSLVGEGYPPVEIARVGEFWDINYSYDSPLRLHEADGSHPNFAGSYLAALDIVSTVYTPIAKHMSYRGSLDENQADFLQDLVIYSFADVQKS